MENYVERKETVKNKTVLITGGTSGLGRACVDVFLDAGWSVATFGRRFDLISEIKLMNKNKNLLAEVCDLRISNHLDNVLETFLKKFKRFDAVILNAGELGKTPLVNSTDLELNDFRSVFETNFFGNISLVLKILKRQPVSNTMFVHITSDAASTPYPGWGPYGSSKAAIDFLFRIMQVEGGKIGNRFVSFDPGDMNTEMHRLALPDDDPENLKNPLDSARELLSVVER
jgi:NAD(P)-dependent dehydrogenase (short-subunit alcohol dehydrogenase family)